MNSTKDSIRANRPELEQALKDAGAEFKGRSIRCPFHDDNHPSGGIYQGESGAWRFKRHAPACGFCGDVFDVKARATGKPVEDQLREHAQPKPAKAPPRIFPSIDAMADSIGHYATVEDRYVYAHPVTRETEMVVFRCRHGDGKKFFQPAKPVPGGFVQFAPPKPWPLFNRSRVATSKVVIVVEGEKCVKALHEVGHIATTSPSGAENADKADWSPLAGKIVFLWPDNDASGAKYMRDVAAQLARLPDPPTVNLIDVAGFSLPEKTDVVEYLAEFGGETKQSKFNAIECAKKLARSFGPSSAVRKLIQSTIDGTRQAVELPWRGIDGLTNALLPGSITVVCGDPGAAKSFWLLQAARKWHRDGVRFALYQLETDEEGSHLLRALVQESGASGLLKPSWMKDNPEESLAVESEHRAFTDSFGARLTTPPNRPPTIDELIRWVEARADEGCRVIAIDPVTAAEASDKPWHDDKRFILAAQSAMRQHNSSLVLVTHPRKGSKGAMTGDDLAGGTAYYRFVQTVLWVRSHYPAKLVRCRTSCGDNNVEVNRSIKIVKSRLGEGAGMELAYLFGSQMQFAEQGVIVKTPKAQGGDSE